MNYHSNGTLNEDEVDDIDEIHHVNENKDVGTEPNKSLKMIKYIILKVLYTNEKRYGNMNENENKYIYQ